jgi:hypothetical protein
MLPIDSLLKTTMNTSLVTSLPFTLLDRNGFLASILASNFTAEILANFLGYPVFDPSRRLNMAAVVCLDAEWWIKDPKPTTELGISELMAKDLSPTAHAGNIMTHIQTAHARIIPYAHLINKFSNAGNPENFKFGTTKFVTMEEAKQVLIDTFVRPAADDPTNLQPIILIGHAVKNEFDHLQRTFGVDLRSYGTIVKVIDTQLMAQEAGIRSPKGPYISLSDLLAHFKISIPNLHSAGNDAAGTLIAAILIALKDKLYPGVGTAPPPLVINGQKVQHAVNALRHIDFRAPAPAWGKAVYCTRCERDNHFRGQCRAFVSCTICRDSGVQHLWNAHKTHSATRCVSVLEYSGEGYAGVVGT